ncbi:hypothetical protein TRFO_27011 [Tritrichomonas foetus]|uniref:MULE transposase domain-containing protein n=1 Tax=Tritrichomonas foetus TaxID=1144522 RepID=A0A1J4K204_9EUKA|nr:hypothetical protein TRFO_27011 [Tritrichomonas foetus]|eukprot:OHT05267.1 hypothetical protein TRFO_27011 [Tritrichomonas foetus]
MKVIFRKHESKRKWNQCERQLFNKQPLPICNHKKFIPIILLIAIFILRETIIQLVHQSRNQTDKDLILYSQFFERIIVQNQQEIRIKWLRQYIVPEKNYLLFTDQMLELFINSQVLMIDGTFKAAPSEFQQILTIMGMRNDKNFPCIHIYLKRRQRYTIRYCGTCFYCMYHDALT